MLELVTGHKGENHVSSSDVGRFNAGLIGQASYRLRVKGNMEATTDGSSVTIATGDAVIQGRHVTNEEPFTQNIQPAATGLQRYDIIAYFYRIVLGDVESVEVAYIMGPEEASAPLIDPDVGNLLDGDVDVTVSVVRCLVTSAGVTTIEQLLPLVDSLTAIKASTAEQVAQATTAVTTERNRAQQAEAALGTRIANATTTEATTNIADIATAGDGWTITQASYRARNGVAQILIYIQNSSGSAKTGNLTGIATVKAGKRPGAVAPLPSVGQGQGSFAPHLRTNGEIRCNDANVAAGGSLFLSGTYLLA